VVVVGGEWVFWTASRRLRRFQNEIRDIPDCRFRSRVVFFDGPGENGRRQGVRFRLRAVATRQKFEIVERSRDDKRDFSFAVRRTIAGPLDIPGIIRTRVARGPNDCFNCPNRIVGGTVRPTS